MLEPIGDRGAEARRSRGIRRALALVAFTALLLGACSQPEELDPAGESFEVTYEVESDGDIKTGALDGATVDGTLRIVVKGNRYVRSVSFYLDDTRMKGSPFVVDSSSPFTAVVKTSELEPGRHSVTVAVYTSKNRRPSVKTVWFTVAKKADAPSEPTPEPTPTP